MHTTEVMWIEHLHYWIIPNKVPIHKSQWLKGDGPNSLWVPCKGISSSRLSDCYLIEVTDIGNWSRNLKRSVGINHGLRVWMDWKRRHLFIWDNSDIFSQFASKNQHLKLGIHYKNIIFHAEIANLSNARMCFHFEC